MNKDIYNLIKYYYYKECYNDCLEEIKNIKYTTDMVISTFPDIPIRIYHTILYIPNNRVIQYGLSEREDNVRDDNCISFYSSCKKCGYDGVRIVNFTSKDGRLTIPIFKWGNSCSDCRKNLKNINKNFKLF